MLTGGGGKICQKLADVICELSPSGLLNSYTKFHQDETKMAEL